MRIQKGQEGEGENKNARRIRGRYLIIHIYALFILFNAPCEGKGEGKEKRWGGMKG